MVVELGNMVNCRHTHTHTHTYVVCYLLRLGELTVLILIHCRYLYTHRCNILSVETVGEPTVLIRIHLSCTEVCVGFYLLQDTCSVLELSTHTTG